MNNVDGGHRPLPFADRADAGRRLARVLDHYRGSDAVVCGLPRGGVPVAFEIAIALNLPLDVLVVRKIGAPFQPELAIGAVGERGVLVVNSIVARLAGVGDTELESRATIERSEAERRAKIFRHGRAPIDLTGRPVILVDDGVATGATCRAGCEVARVAGASRVVLGVPVAAADSLAGLSDVADESVCLATPAGFGAVGEWYVDFGQTSDAEVSSLLAAAAARSNGGSDGGG